MKILQNCWSGTYYFRDQVCEMKLHILSCLKLNFNCGIKISNNFAFVLITGLILLELKSIHRLRPDWPNQDLILFGRLRTNYRARNLICNYSSCSRCSFCYSLCSPKPPEPDAVVALVDGRDTDSCVFSPPSHGLLFTSATHRGQRRRTTTSRKEKQ